MTILQTTAVYGPLPIHRRFSAVGRSAAPVMPREESGWLKDLTSMMIEGSGTTHIRLADSQNATIEMQIAYQHLDTHTLTYVSWPDGKDSTTELKREFQEGTIEDFLGKVYSLAKIGDVAAANDQIFERLDRLQCDGDFPACNEILANVDVDRIPTSLMRAFLAITLAGRSKLPYRRFLYKQIEQRMKSLRGSPATQRLIGRLA